MSTGQWAVVLRHVRRLFEGGGVSGMSEGQLLERFAESRDEAAFGAILARHGPMVLGVCRGVLDDPHDVDDAFQATFLVLVKKAASLRDGDRLAPWLYGVARRVSLRARSDATLRKARERIGPEEPTTPPPTLDAELRELQTLIREEVDRLPGVDRMAVVLCYLEGLTHEEAADRLGWPVGTVKGRLARARDKLRDRLTRRGVALPTAIGPVMAGGAKVAIPAGLLRSTTLAAMQLASGKTLAAGTVSAHAIALMEGVIGTMFVTKLKIVAATLVAAGTAAVPAVLGHQGRSGDDPFGQVPASASKPSLPPAPDTLPTAVNDFTKATPNAGLNEMARVAEQALKVAEQMAIRGTGQYDSALTWSRRLVEAKAGPGSPEADRTTVLRGHLERMKRLLEIAKARKATASGTDLEVLEAEYRIAEAELWLRNGGMTSVVEAKPPVAEAGFGAFPSRTPRPLTLKTMPGDEQRNKAINAKLEEPIAMNFPTETPLEDVLKYVKESTQDGAAGLPTGLPIYVDPLGLQEVDKNMTDTVKLSLEGIPLRTTLKLLLHQIDLTYRVEGGLVLITNEDLIVGPGKPGGGGGFQ